MKSFSKFGVAALAFVGMLVLYGVAASAVASKNSQLALLQNQIQLETQTAQRAAAFRTALNEIAGDEAAIHAYFVTNSQVVAFIDDLQARGAAQHTIVDISSVEATAASRPQLSLSLTIKGSFAAVLRTVGAIEYAPYDLSVSTLTLTQSGPSAWIATMAILVGSAPELATTSPQTL